LFRSSSAGAPLDDRNFQLQAYAGECNAKDKDKLEFELSRLATFGELIEI
jgi:hypothetical protein